MKLLCINYEYPPIGGGGGVVSKGLAEALVKIGYHIDLVTSGMNGLPEFEIINGVHVHRVKCIRRYRHYVTLPEMATLIFPLYTKALRLVHENDYQLNHTHFIFPSGLVSYLLKKRTGLQYILTCHGSDVPGYNPDRFHLSHKLLKHLWKEIIKNSRGVSTPSQYLKKMIQSQINIPIDVIPNGYDFLSRAPSAKRHRILVVTRMFERKGVQFFIKAVADLNSNWEILIAGDGPYLSNLKEQARHIPAIKFLGFVKGPALAQLYESSKIFVFPSVQENFPVVLLEAMEAGCAIITTDAPGCVEVVGNAAIITRCGKISDIRKAIEFLMTNENEAKRLSCKARNRASEFAWNNIACHFDELSQRCLCQPRLF